MGTPAEDAALRLCNVLVDLEQTILLRTSLSNNVVNSSGLWEKVISHRNGSHDNLFQEILKGRVVPAVSLHTRQRVDGSLWKGIERLEIFPHAEVLVELSGNLFKPGDSRWLFTMFPEVLLPLVPVTVGGIGFAGDLDENSFSTSFEESLNLKVDEEATSIWLSLQSIPYHKGWSYSVAGRQVLRAWTECLQVANPVQL